MKKAPIGEDDDKRIEKIKKFSLESMEIEQDFQNFAKIAAYVCDVPSSFVTVVGSKSQWLKADFNSNLASESPRDVSFCGHTILQDELFVVNDTRLDDRFFDNPHVIGGPKINFYVGYPIKIEGENVGSLCVIDSKPRMINEKQQDMLKSLGQQLERTILLRKSKFQLTEQNDLIREKNKILKISNRVNKQLIAMLSHDIRGPLGSILSYLKGNDKRQEPEQYKKFISLMTESLQSIYNMIDNALDWSSKVGNIQTKQVDVLAIFERVKKLYASQLEHKSNKLIFKSSVGNSVIADPMGLEFVMRNLIGNAIKYTKSGEIKVILTELGDQVNIEMTDTGMGMSKGFIEKVLDQGRNVSTRGTDQEKGSGMGLNFVQEILNKMGSKLTLRSEEGKGSSFSFTLPKA